MSESAYPNPNQPPSEWPPGLHEGQSPEELVFALPGMGDDELCYVVDAGQAIDRMTGDATLKLTKRAVQLAFPKAGTFIVGAYEVAEVAAADLFEGAMAHMLATIGDAHTTEAARVLREAMAEPDATGKNFLRNRAATLLHNAYSEYGKSIEVKVTELDAPEVGGWKGFLREVMDSGPDRDQLTKDLIRLHAKAASRAIAISLINRQMGLAPSAISRAEDASKHWSENYRLRIKRAHDAILSAPKTYFDTEYDAANYLKYLPEAMREQAGITVDWNAEAENLVKTGKEYIETARSGTQTGNVKIVLSGYLLDNIRARVADLEQLQASKHRFTRLHASLGSHVSRVKEDGS